MDRELTSRERDVLALLSSVDKPGAEIVRESLPYLRVTGGCSCGCESFNLQDSRFAAAASPGVEDWSGAVSHDGVTILILFVGSDGRPTSVDVLMPNRGQLPDATSLRLT